MARKKKMIQKKKSMSFKKRLEAGIEAGLYAVGLPGIDVKITKKKKKAKSDAKTTPNR